MKKFWNYEERDGETRLRLDGPIADDQIWGDEMTPAAFRRELEEHPGDIVVYVNSPGGSVLAASQIYSMLLEHPGRTVARVESIAASAASVVVMACDRVEMARTAYLMIHRASTVQVGNEVDMDEAARQLREIDKGIRAAYADKTGLADEVIAQMMVDESFICAEDAIALGFADGYIEPRSAGADPGAPAPAGGPRKADEERAGALARLNLVAMI